MREYDFRGKRIDTKEWVYGGIVTDDPKGVQIVRWNSFGLGYLETYVVDPNTVGQFTELPDKNGVKIFEGDVLAYPKYGNLAVVWDDGMFQLEKNDTFYERLDHFSCADAAVIGNIHDNPELLAEVSDNG